jgi:hypothetical protein
MDMKKYWLGGLLFVAFLLPLSSVYAVHVNGYYRSNGTYVQPYERTAPDSSPYNNYGYPGNYNPNTGTITGGSQETYLNNYYGTSGTYSSPSPSYSYPTTPSCPINSYYNGSSCTCNSGYVVGTDYSGQQSCVSGDSKCTDSMGYGAQYDSLSNTCKCRYGYVQSGSKCVSETTYCTNSLGLMSQYNSLTKQCECILNYEYKGSSCVYKSANTYSYSPTPTYSPPTTTCPVNSYLSSTDSKCYCNSGYQNNSANTSCVPIPVPQCPAGASPNGNTCACSYGFAYRSGQCITNTADCGLTFGSNVTGAPGTNNNSSCSCAPGYQWNSAKTACVVMSTTNTSATASVANAISGLTTAQINSIIALLQSFGADATTIAGVQSALGR